MLYYHISCGHGFFIYVHMKSKKIMVICTTTVLAQEAMAHNSKDTTTPVIALNVTWFPIFGVIHLFKQSLLHMSGQHAHVQAATTKLKQMHQLWTYEFWDLYLTCTFPEHRCSHKYAFIIQTRETTIAWRCIRFMKSDQERNARHDAIKRWRREHKVHCHNHFFFYI